MFLGFDDSLKPLKKALRSAGADVSVVQRWQKSYDKVLRQTPVMEEKYNQARRELETVYEILLDMERAIITSEEPEKVDAMGQGFRRYQTNFDHEFLISKADTEFHTTYAGLLKLCAKKNKTTRECLIRQSEVENLMALVKEALAKELPEYRAMAYYYIERSDKELSDLPHAEKIAKVRRVYENEFIQPMREFLKRYNMVLEDWIWN